MAERRPTDEQRQKERAEARPRSPKTSGGGFDVQPPHLYYTSLVVRDGQFDYDKGATALVEVLNGYSQSAGAGWGADAFAAAYKSVTEKFLELWAKSVVSVGGVAVGLTHTANKYVQADWQARRMYGPPPVDKAPPAVIENPPRYGPVNDIKWSGTGEDADSSEFAGIAGEIPDFLADVIRPAIEHGLRLGKMHEITPGCRDEEFQAMATAWGAAAKAAKAASDDFNGAVKFISNNKGNDEWQGAMKAFCQTIWGTTEWGRTYDKQMNRVSIGRTWKTDRKVVPAKRRPIIDVLRETAEAVQKQLDELAGVAVTTRETTTRLGKDAAKATVRDLTTDLDPFEMTRLAATLAFGEIVLTFRSHMDKAAADAAVEKYHQAFSDAAAALKALEPELDEALLSVPTFVAEEARAEAYGARSLNDFKKEHSWQRPESTIPYRYSLDLATEEELHGGHSIDKHVGLTDLQLTQRLRDESSGSGHINIPAASTFTDLESAQNYTQYNIRSNTAAIETWLKGNPPDPRQKEFTVGAVGAGNQAFPVATGRTAQVVGGHPTPAKDAYGVSTVLKYEPSLDPPFVVLTSMPQ
ncbi:RNase A-like domain-containing protein [Streptomyces griseosporeus]|uniref:RNase A-like domain-containing protein n=1 Tax=Streptomyces griseosporeus TaxID=1910 RepID=UPI00167E87DA|nr:RNase A-like domain-containing protein [Streptomyces griseosporeus]